MSCLVGPPSLLLTSPPDARCHAISAAAAAVVRAQHSFPRTSVIVAAYCHMVLPLVCILPIVYILSLVHMPHDQRCYGLSELSLN